MNIACEQGQYYRVLGLSVCGKHEPSTQRADRQPASTRGSFRLKAVDQARRLDDCSHVRTGQPTKRAKCDLPVTGCPLDETALPTQISQMI
jgi:hypothetical protein